MPPHGAATAAVVLKVNRAKQGTASATNQRASVSDPQQRKTQNGPHFARADGDSTPRRMSNPRCTILGHLPGGSARAAESKGEVDKVTMSARMRIYYYGTQKEREHTAACHLQAVIRGYAERKAFFSERGFKINLKYELSILRRRTERRGLLFGCAQHLTYIILLTIVILVQSGGPKTNFELKTSINEYIENVETSDGMTFEDVGTITVRLVPTGLLQM